MATITVTVRSRVPEVSAKVRRRAEQIVEKAALDVEAQAKLRAPVDTGLLRNSIHVQPISPLERDVTSPVHYSVYQEFGTRHMAAQPYMTPAAEFVYPKFLFAMRRLIP